MRMLSVALVAALLTGCSALTPRTSPAEILEALPTARSETDLLALPSKGKPLNVGIYNCMDSTGQKRKGVAGTADFSSAVPQDCAPFLMAALRAMPHYRVLERSRIDDVLKERQLALVTHGEKTRSVLGGLFIADILLLGQVVSYDRSTTQASGGVAINAIGMAHQRVADTFTFSLRAVSTKSGEVLNEVLVKKTVESLQLNGNVLRIIGVDTHSAELGAASNEPAGVALQQAIQLGVRTITEKGLGAGWWSN